jgi:DnaJ-class molecular chaperone
VGLTYYELFGVSQTATNEEIEKAYRNASKAYHPHAHFGHIIHDSRLKMRTGRLSLARCDLPTI